mmetsp:Transcript_33689/g.107653  ORF Transcript_33689/g.107653 Transcript_33689/m.107653 type:complete len:594 (+) Transcript_33689:100-1881(+)
MGRLLPLMVVVVTRWCVLAANDTDTDADTDTTTEELLRKVDLLTERVAELESNSTTSLQRKIDKLTEQLAELESTTLRTADGDAFWLIFGTVLVFLMQAGFAMVEVGSVQRQNTKKILMKNIFDASVAALFWWATGYAFAFGSDPFGDTGRNGFIGESGFFYQGEGAGDEASPLTNTPEAKTYGQALWLFHWAFAGAAATIVSGAVAERCSMRAYFCYSCYVSSIVYPVVVHMAWSLDGKFSAKRASRLFGGCGLIDWAGSAVVHLTGGVAALVAVTFIGPRTGRFGRSARHLQQQSYTFQTLGTLLLWTGWYGFNGVSTLALGDYGGVAAHSLMTTTVAAATSCLASTGLGIYLDSQIDATYANNGILAGLVAITAGCATSNIFGAFFTGLVAAFVYVGASRTLENYNIDDVVDAFPVHGCCGAWGVIAAALFATPFYYTRAYSAYVTGDRADDCAGLFYGGDGGSLSAAVVFVLANLAWTGGNMVLLFSILKVTLGIRTAEEADELGLDDSKHGGQPNASGIFPTNKGLPGGQVIVDVNDESHTPVNVTHRTTSAGGTGGYPKLQDTTTKVSTVELTESSTHSTTDEHKIQ